MKKEQHWNRGEVTCTARRTLPVPPQLPRASGVRSLEPTAGLGQPVRGMGQARPFSLWGRRSDLSADLW